MSSQLDDLFKEKLSGHSLAPSDQAWIRVKDSLSKKNNGIVLFRIAAALLLLGALTTIIVQVSNRTAMPVISGQSDSKSNQTSPIPEKQSAKADIGKKTDQSFVQAKKKDIRQVSKAEEVTTIPETTNQIQQPATNEVVLQSGQPVTAEITPAEKPIVLEYRLDAIPVHISPQPEVAVQEKSGLRRVIDLAREAKNGESPLSLRQTKDELFALNFKKSIKR